MTEQGFGITSVLSSLPVPLQNRRPLLMLEDITACKRERDQISRIEELLFGPLSTRTVSPRDRREGLPGSEATWPVFG